MSESPQFTLQDPPYWLGEAIPGTLEETDGKYTIHIYPREARALILKGEKVQRQRLEDGRFEFFKINLAGRKILLGESKIQRVKPRNLEVVRFWMT